MSNQPINSSLAHDDRAVAPVIGVVILFGFLILALSLYQVEVVPQQNAEVEFQQFEETRNDLVELRAGILQAGSIDQPQYQTVQLGTTYPTRVFMINPPPPAGTIRTTDAYPITIAYESNGTVIETIPTRFIQYRPGYRELDQPPTWYDASVLYLDARQEGGEIAVIEDQALVDGGEVQITALQNELRRSDTGRVTVELRPAESVTGDIPEGNLSVTVPTQLSGEEYWDGADIPTEHNITNDTNNDGVHNLTLETTASNLTIDTVGVQEGPEEPTQNDNALVGGGAGDGNTGSDGDDGGSDPLPNSAVAFNDEDGDGVYDDGEQTYTKSETTQLDTSIDLVIEKDIISDNIDIGTQSVQLKNGARLDTNKELKLDVSGRIDIVSGTLASDDKVTLKSGSSGIDAQDATLEGEKEMKITADGGDINLTGANADSNKKITLAASGRIDAQDAALESEKEMKITANDGGIDLTGANVDSNDKITLIASGRIDAKDATLESAKEMKITANSGDINTRGGILISNKMMIVTSSADIDVRDTELQAEDRIEASPASSGTLFVNDNGGTRADGGTYIEDKTGGESEISLQQGSVDGTPEKGSVV